MCTEYHIVCHALPSIVCGLPITSLHTVTHSSPSPHVYACIHHTPSEDGCKLYQPAERREKGSIGIALVREVLDRLSETNLGGWIVEGRECRVIDVVHEEEGDHPQEVAPRSDLLRAQPEPHG